jgi:putative glycosyltransferase (TIGR04372 family)
MLKKMLKIIPNKALTIFGYTLAPFLLALLRMLKPMVLIRIGIIAADRLGHFAGNMEIYLCEQENKINCPAKNYIDLFTLHKPISNLQFDSMLRRKVLICPGFILNPVFRLNSIVPGGKVHEILSIGYQHERDIYNLLDKSRQHFYFSESELKFGAAELSKMGISKNEKIVCLMVRDNAYLKSHIPGDWTVHDYRDSNIDSYEMAVLQLIARGYCVIRMGAKVGAPVKLAHPMYIDYATNGMRSDFMDIFLAHKCQFAISTGNGWDAVPGWIFRKPVVFVNDHVMGFISSYTRRFLVIPKKFYYIKNGKLLSLKEIFSTGIGVCMNSYELESFGVKLIDNSPDEIRDVVIQMVEQLENPHKTDHGYDYLMGKFIKNYPLDIVHPINKKILHGEFRAKIGKSFLEKNQHLFE